MGAVINSVFLIGGSLYILSQAVPRILSPEPTQATGMLLLAVGGIVVNGLAILRLKGGQSLNLQVATCTMGKNVTQKLIEGHLIEAEMKPGEEIGLKIDQTLTQDATGTMVMLELEAMQIPHVETELSAQYVDHNLIQEDFKNPDDHLFLRSACQKFGVWYSRPGNGVSHPVHED